MDIEELSVNLSSDDPAIGLRASLALHRLAERSKRTRSRRPGKRAGRGSRSETLWASPPIRARQAQQGIIMTTESVVPEMLHGWAIYLRASEEARREVTAELAPINLARLAGASLDRSRIGREPGASSPGPWSLDHEALAPWVWGPAPTLPHCRCAPCRKAKDQRHRAKRSPPHGARGKKVLEGASSATVGGSRSRPSRCDPDPHSPTTRSAAVLLGALGVNTSEVGADWMRSRPTAESPATFTTSSEGVRIGPVGAG